MKKIVALVLIFSIALQAEAQKRKLKAGMKILIREGSAAKNFEALHQLLNDHHDRIMFCSDDKHPDELLEGHINTLVRRAVERGQIEVWYQPVVDLERAGKLLMLVTQNVDGLHERSGFPAERLVAIHGSVIK